MFGIGEKLKIGILGGTFDPVHLGHIQLAEAAKKQFSLDEIWLMPAKIPPHKQDKQIASEEARTEMLRLAAENLPGFRVSTFEFERNEVSYTAETLKLLSEEYPEDSFYYLMGEDSLKWFPQWYHPEIIVAHADILVAPRASVESEELHKQVELCEQQLGKHFYIIETPWVPVSSTDIRKHLAEGNSTEGELHPLVRKYIEEHCLYGVSTKREFSKKLSLKEAVFLLKEVLSEKRFLHTEGVAYTAAALAMRYGASIEAALWAGWLHDNAKENTGEQLFEICNVNNINVSDAERNNLQLLHGKVGACWAKERYAVSDNEVLSAITYHVTGRPQMSLLEQIIYIADYIEPSRKMQTVPPLNDIRQLAFMDINKATAVIAGGILKHLHTTGATIDPMTQETYDYYAGLTDK